MDKTLLVNEIFLSLQGESTYLGWPCVFIRLTGCPLRCSYCDTAYAFQEGQTMTLDAILTRVRDLAGPYHDASSSLRLPLVEVTGGEPLVQLPALELLKRCCDLGYTVLLETNGVCDLAPIDRRVHCIMDLKCPSSGESGRHHTGNLAQLRPTDELKFVIATEEDYDWAKDMIQRHDLARRCPVLFSWAAPLSDGQRDPSLKPRPAHHKPLTLRSLAERIVADALPVRFQPQLHKWIWSHETRAV